MPDKLPIDPGKPRHFGLRREPFGYARDMWSVRQGVGTVYAHI
jgi:hypothetical protein